MKREVAAIWDTKEGTYLPPRKNRTQFLAKAGWTTPEGAARYAKAMEHCLGRGLRKRIKEAIN